jgi:hypothetical protein
MRDPHAVCNDSPRVRRDTTADATCNATILRCHGHRRAHALHAAPADYWLGQWKIGIERQRERERERTCVCARVHVRVFRTRVSKMRAAHSLSFMRTELIHFVLSLGATGDLSLCKRRWALIARITDIQTIVRVYRESVRDSLLRTIRYFLGNIAVIRWSMSVARRLVSRIMISG